MPASNEKSECPIHLTAITNPNNIAIQTVGESITYLHLDAMVAHCCTRLQKLKIGAGTLVGIYANPSPWCLALLFALFRSNAVAVPLNTRFPAETVPDILARIGCSRLICDSTTMASSATETVEKIRINEFISDDLQTPSEVAWLMDYDQPVTVIFSSGSTGFPRAVLHSWGNHWFNALGSNSNIRLIPGDKWLLSLPLYHVAGIAILFRSFQAGSSIIIPDGKKGLEENLLEFKITHASLVATQLKRLLDYYRSRGSMRCLKALLVGGSAIPESLISLSVKHELPIFLTYGLSEMASQVTTTPPNCPARGYKTSGKVLPYRDVSSTPENEIRVRGNTLFLGYLEKNNLVKPFDADGWFHTGDLGCVDEDGWLTVQGRKDNMFISGGENIYPEYIERVLERHPAIQRSLVVPVNDEEYGMRPVAFVDANDVSTIIEEVETFLDGKLPRYMLPIKYIAWTESPGRQGIKDSRMAFKQKAAEILGKDK